MGPRILLSLPPAMAASFDSLEGSAHPGCFAACDPVGAKLGSGGGSVHLLLQAWRRTGEGLGFLEWLRSSRKLLIHGGGRSRRLPAYAACGKLLAPMPVWRWASGQRLDQSLLDLQAGACLDLLDAAGEGTAAMIASGDALIGFDLPAELPRADALGCGLWVPPEEAQAFGVFFVDPEDPAALDFFLQKPSPELIRERSADRHFLVDSGIWLLSEAALGSLFARCGLDISDPRGQPSSCEFYSDFALGLGRRPSRRDEAASGLSAAVLPLPGGSFRHFGSSRELIDSSLALQNRVLDQRLLQTALPKPHPSIFVQNARVDVRLDPANRSLWIENSHVGRGWSLSRRHVITGAPENSWELELEDGTCLDFAPIGKEETCVRAYGFEDDFRGPLAEASWFGESASLWFERRGIAMAAAGLDPGGDIQSQALFPVEETRSLDSAYLGWLIARDPGPSAAFAERWTRGERLCADGLGERTDLGRLYAQRKAFRLSGMAAMEAHGERSAFYALDLARAAAEWAPSALPGPEKPERGGDPIREIRRWMFRSELGRLRGEASWESDEGEAFAVLRRALLASLPRPRPRRSVLQDQIIWARSPVRVDLAGGWTDTPPYCLMNGGRVVNAAIELGGQAPIQCYVRPCDEPRISISSIDLGIKETVGDYESLAAHDRVGSGFSIAKAALCQCGFHPAFGARGATLRAELEAFGGGFDLSLLSAVPKGSGLGTSSILAGTVLGALGELCGFPWDARELTRRVLAVEQMLGTGGGWQDQAGGILGGLKLIESRPGLGQELSVRWLPEACLSRERCESLVLLYYTGITRVAKGILREIVRGIFLNSSRQLELLRRTGENALALSDAASRGDWSGFCSCVARTWELNQSLDSGTNPAPVAAIIERVRDYLEAWKLPGAGGGGFLLMFAKDEEAARRARRELEENPPNPRARFVGLSLSATGLQVTKS